MPGAALWAWLLSSCSTHTANQWRRMDSHHAASEPGGHPHTGFHSVGQSQAAGRQGQPLAAGGAERGDIPEPGPVTSAHSMARAHSWAAPHLEHQPCVLPPYGAAVHRNVAPSIPSPRVLSPRSRTCPEQHFWSLGSVLLHPNCSTQHPERSGRGRTSPHLHSSASTLLEAALHPP